MKNFEIGTFLKEISEVIEEQKSVHHNKAKNRIDDIYKFRSSLIDRIIQLSEGYGLLVIRNEIVYYHNEQHTIDIALYNDDDCVLAIEITSSRLKRAIMNLLHHCSLYRLLITYYREASFCKNLLLRYDEQRKITLLHIKNLKYDTPEINKIPSKLGIKNVNSPLEVKIENALKEYGIKFESQYAVYQKMGSRNSWIPKYIIDFVIYGEHCKIAVECDGLRYHLTDQAKVYDTERDLWLLKNGFDEVIRLPGDKIKENLSECMNMIRSKISAWDQFYEMRNRKAKILNTNLDVSCIGDYVQIVLRELLPVFHNITLKKKETTKEKIKQFVNTIFRAGYSPNIQTFYYQLPQLSELITKGNVHCAFVGYNIPFVLYYVESLSQCQIPSWLRNEKRVVKLIIYKRKYQKRLAIGRNTRSYVLINGSNGIVEDSDIVNNVILKQGTKPIKKENTETLRSVHTKESQLTPEVQGSGMMEKKKTKYYVVWIGKQTGIFSSWDECKQYVLGVASAKYKSFSSIEEAKQAYHDGWTKYYRTAEKAKTSQQISLNLNKDMTYIEESICVDAACSGNPGQMEYKGVYTKTGKVLFHFGPILGTNNVGEFLAIVHALAFLKQYGKDYPIYSDSLTAIKWVKTKKVNTALIRNKDTERVWRLIERAKQWLKKNDYNNPILKWETDIWGEIKADFGRK